MKNERNNLVEFLLLIVGMAIFVHLAGQGIDRHIDSQNVMLCESALKSENAEWLGKCTEYYETGNIEYLREAGH